MLDYNNRNAYLYPGSWYSYDEVEKMLKKHNKKEDDMNNIYVHVNGRNYRPSSITSRISSGTCPEFEIDLQESSYFKCNPYEPVNVIFNNPATIVFWGDGTKTVVKCVNEEFDPEKGLAMAIAKKALGNTREYYETFKKWVPEEKKEEAKAEAPKENKNFVAKSCLDDILDEIRYIDCLFHSF